MSRTQSLKHKILLLQKDVREANYNLGFHIKIKFAWDGMTENVNFF